MNSDQQVVYLHLDDIIPNRFQPREVFDERALKELAVSIKEHGVIQPIIVRKINNNNKYEIIAGERRYKAAAIAGLTTIPAIVRNLDDKETAKVALLENLQRKNLNPIEEARTYQKIIELDQMTQEELAKTMGKSQSAVANKLRLLALPDEVQKSLLKEEISERHARTLLNLETPEEQNNMLKRIVKEKMTVRQLENEIKGINMPEKDQISANEDLDSIINPKPVPIETKEASKDTSFLMSPISNSNDNIINYGEINDDEDNENEDAEDFRETSISQEPLDLSKLKSNAVDISHLNDSKNEKSTDKKDSLTDLDSLLNLNTPNNFNEPVKNSPSFTPAEEALRESENKNYENKEDYFSAPDLMSIELPNSNSNAQAGNSYNKETDTTPGNIDSLLDFAKSPIPFKKNNYDNNNDNESADTQPNDLLNVEQTLFQKPIDKTIENTNNLKANKSLGLALMSEAYNENSKNRTQQYNIQQMVNAIRKTLSDLEMHGAKIDTDEMNFENQYQIVIKIDKNSNF